MKRITILLYILLAVGNATAQKSHNFQTAKQLDIFNSLYRALDLNYVDTLDAEKLIRVAINEMLNDVDPYTTYYKSEETDDLKALSTGKYAGIGSPIVYRKDLDCAVFNDPYMDMPAYRSGVRSGDRLIRINGKVVCKERPTDTQTYLSDITNQLRGEPGTTVVVDVERPIADGLTTPDSVQSITIPIVRQQIRRSNVTAAKMIDESVGYIYLTGYTEGAATELKTAFLALKSQGMKQLILDLRGNGGGLLQEAVDMVGLFVRRGCEVVSMRGRSERSNETFKTTRDPIDRRIPIVVLTDYYTASAAEITCGALQDMDRAVIVGERTYGKGLVQQSLSLPYDGALKYTVAKYYIPSGRCIQALDYAHRGEDGQPTHLADSLCKTYHTVAGRPVRDGGGITPDVIVKPDTMPSIIPYLRLSPQFSDWVTIYTNTHERIAPASDFHIQDEDMDNLQCYLKAHKFKYNDHTKQMLTELRQSARIEGYDAISSELFDSLELRLTHNIEHDFKRWNKDLRKLIELELIANYYGESETAVFRIDDDPTVKKALQILHTADTYQSLLAAPGKN